MENIADKYLKGLIEGGRRSDGRKLDEFREIEVKVGVMKNAEGSALVKIGDTKVIAGIKMEIVEPFKDTPEEGVLKVNAEFSPLASPEFEIGPPSEDAIELARVVDRGIRESRAIELERLCLEPKLRVWGVFIDIDILNHCGNLLDASALASIAALLNTKIPKLENGEIVRGKFEKALQVAFKPITITVCKVGNNFLLDPSYEEEEIVETKLSFGIRDDDKICAIQKYGSKELEFSDIEAALDLAVVKSKELRKLLG
ncbi:MAG: exosome complex protein Rrp42 [Candidatus Aenigmarchaeota archaeon]|nr:exosome complex protein Rrp42 [Candidatus Aenigmarchaeota archaeon]